MTFSENKRGTDIPVEKSLPELQAELNGIQQERFDLGTDIEAQGPKIPKTVILYLSESCPNAKLMPSLLSELAALSKQDPTVFEDFEFSKLIVDDCITRVMNEAELKIENSKTIQARDLDTTASVVTAININTANLNGRDKLMAARNYLSHSGIPDNIRSELQARFKQIETTLASMSVVFPDPTSQSEFDLIVANTAFDFSASDMAATFAPIIEQVEASDKFTVEQKYKLREIVTGSDAQNSLTETVTDETGRETPRFTPDNKREFRQGVSGYVEGRGRQMIEARAGDRMITKDVTGWSGEDVGLLIEATHLWNMYDSSGVTGFIEDVYKIDFSILGDGNAFDPIQIMHLRQVLSFLTGSFEGYDGDIANLTEHKTIIQNQARLMSDMQTAFGWENDRSGTTKTLRRLGLEDKDGHPDMDIIKAFGDYTREHYATGAVDQAGLTDYLHKRFPNKVRPLSDTERAIGNLGV